MSELRHPSIFIHAVKLLRNPRALLDQAWNWIWRPSERPWRRRSALVVQMVIAVAQRMASGMLPLRAMSLVYTTLLSLVPLLAVSFSVLKAFGVHNQVEPLLLNFLAPLGEQGEEITAQIIEFVDNIQVGVLGALGLAFLLYTVIALVQKVELAFNTIWHIRHPRTLARRFSDYLSVLLVGPVLVFTALGITASLATTEVAQSVAAIEPFGSLMQFGGRMAPYLFIVLAFTFVYLFIPNTRVRVGAALVGALIAGLAWQATGWVFAAFIAGSARYAAIYSGFAILVLFMIWLYLSWLILLLGAQIAFYIQHPHFLHPGEQGNTPVGTEADTLALAAMYHIGCAHRDGLEPPTEDELARRLGVSGDAMEPLLERLNRAGLTRHAAEPGLAIGLLPGRALDQIPLQAILAAIRDPVRSIDKNLPRALGQLNAALEVAGQGVVGDRNLADLLDD